VGATVFRYYPYIPGAYLPEGARLLHVTDDPDAAAKAAVGDSLVSDAKLFIAGILPMIRPRAAAPTAPLRGPAPEADLETLPLTPEAVYAVVADAVPEDYVLLTESPSNVAQMQTRLRIDKPDMFHACASGGLGWTLPAAAGLAIGEARSGRKRPVICFMGDGSFQYSLQAVYTAVQQRAHVIYVVLNNGEYGILKQFAQLEETPGVPGLDLPGLDIGALGQGYGAHVLHAADAPALGAAMRDALAHEGTSVVVVPIARDLAGLLG